MKIRIITDLSDIVSTLPEDPASPIITDDGAKLVTVTLSGASLSAACTATVASLITLMGDVPADKTMYISQGTIQSAPQETRYTLVVGISGMADLDARIAKLPRDILNVLSTRPQVPGEYADVVEEPTDPNA